MANLGDPNSPMRELFRPAQRSPFSVAPLDLTKIEFPTDRLTIKDLRRWFPTSFDLPAADGHLYDVEGPFNRVSLETGLGDIIDAERVLAYLAYCKARGIAPPKRLGYRDEIAGPLADDYVSAGLASGTATAEQLIRVFEQAAAAQGRQDGPGSPTR